MAARTKLTLKKKLQFLRVLADTCQVTLAAKAIHMSRFRLYEVRKRDAAFGKQWDKAVALSTEKLEDEAARRARQGVKEPVFQGGKKVGTIQRYSDTLLIFLLKGRKPAVYRDNYRIEHAGAIAGIPTATVMPVDIAEDAAAKAYLEIMGEDVSETLRRVAAAEKAE